MLLGDFSPDYDSIYIRSYHSEFVSLLRAIFCELHVHVVSINYWPCEMNLKFTTACPPKVIQTLKLEM